jgi:hypothetical protein
VLSQAQIDAFIADGFVAVRGAVPPPVLRACQDEIWSQIEAQHGVRRADPATWRHPVVRISCPESAAFAAAGTQPALQEAFDQLIGEGRWWRRQGVGGSVPARFPSPADPGDAGWHIDTSFEKDGGWRVNFRSRARGLLALYLFTDVDAGSAPTRLRAGSHWDVAPVLKPAGEDGISSTEISRLAAAASAGRPEVPGTGQAGDVYLCHPFLVHAASWPHTGTAPRLLAQPAVALHDAFPLTPPLSPAEIPIAGPADAGPGGRLTGT